MAFQSPFDQPSYRTVPTRPKRKKAKRKVKKRTARKKAPTKKRATKKAKVTHAKSGGVTQSQFDKIGELAGHLNTWELTALTEGLIGKPHTPWHLTKAQAAKVIKHLKAKPKKKKAKSLPRGWYLDDAVRVHPDHQLGIMDDISDLTGDKVFTVVYRNTSGRSPRSKWVYAAESKTLKGAVAETRKLIKKRARLAIPRPETIVVTVKQIDAMLEKGKDWIKHREGEYWPVSNGPDWIRAQVGTKTRKGARLVMFVRADSSRDPRYGRGAGHEPMGSWKTAKHNPTTKAKAKPRAHTKNKPYEAFRAKVTPALRRAEQLLTKRTSRLMQETADGIYERAVDRWGPDDNMFVQSARLYYVPLVKNLQLGFAATKKAAAAMRARATRQRDYNQAVKEFTRASWSVATNLRRAADLMANRVAGPFPKEQRAFTNELDTLTDLLHEGHGLAINPNPAIWRRNPGGSLVLAARELETA